MAFDFSPIALLNMVFSLLVVLLSLSVHESAHAWSAWKLGDPTAKMLGRVTLNPIPHIDPIGTLLLPVVLTLLGGPVFGWAKPVPILSRNFRNIRRDGALVALAGPASNLALAFLTTLAVLGFRIVLGPAEFTEQWNSTYTPLWALLSLGQINLILAAFNLIPLPPLDGSWVLSALLPQGVARMYEQLRPYGGMLLLVMVVTGLHRFFLFPIFKLLMFVFYFAPLTVVGQLLGA